jgi:hypothetical protein
MVRPSKVSGPGWQTRAAAFVKEMVLGKPAPTTESAAQKSGNLRPLKASKRAKAAAKTPAKRRSF